MQALGALQPVMFGEVAREADSEHRHRKAMLFNKALKLMRLNFSLGL